MSEEEKSKLRAEIAQCRSHCAEVGASMYDNNASPQQVNEYVKRCIKGCGSID